MNIEPELFDLSVEADIVAQVPPTSIDVVEGEPIQNSLNNSLIIEFNIAISYRSVIKDHDTKEYVFSAWDSESKKEAYLDRLQRSSFYDDINEVIVEVEGFIPKPTQPPQPEGKIDLWIIIGGALGGAAFLFLCVFFILRSRGTSGSNGGYDQTKASSSALSNNHRVAA